MTVKSVEMKKKTSIKRTKHSYKYSWIYVFLVLLTLAVIIVIVNPDFFSLVAGAVRGGGGGTKKALPDLIASMAELQNIEKRLKDGNLLYNAQIGAGVYNNGEARSKESVFRVGAKGDSLEKVITTVSYLDATGKLILSATTKYVTITNYNSAFVDISVDTLMPYSGPGKFSESYSVLFLELPINMPPADGTVSETKFTFYGQADVSLIISESNENNNYKENSYIFRCAYLNSNDVPNCCVHRVDPLSRTYSSIRGNYCEDYPPYHVLYLPA